MTIRTFVFALLVGIGLGGSANTAAQSAPLPPFKMLLSNGQFFTASDLAKNRPVVLIYFAPDCEHCQQLLHAVFEKIDAFKKAELVLVTFKPVSELLLFERSYQTAKYSNVKVGTEGTTFYLRNFYKMQHTPFTALYDKGGKLVDAYRKEPPVEDLINRLNSLK